MAIRSLKTGQFSRSTLVGNPIIMPGSYESIATVEVGAGGAANVEFTSIPSTYKHLQVRALIRTNRLGTTFGTVWFRLNNDSGANYTTHRLYGDGGSSGANAWTGETYARLEQVPADNASANIFGVKILDILDYSNTNKYKTIRCLDGFDLNGNGIIRLGSNLWQSTNAITSIKFEDITAANLSQYSHFALYGVN